MTQDREPFARVIKTDDGYYFIKLFVGNDIGSVWPFDDLLVAKSVCKTINAAHSKALNVSGAVPRADYDKVVNERDKLKELLQAVVVDRYGVPNGIVDKIREALRD